MPTGPTEREAFAKAGLSDHNLEPTFSHRRCFLLGLDTATPNIAALQSKLELSESDAEVHFKELLELRSKVGALEKERESLVDILIDVAPIIDEFMLKLPSAKNLKETMAFRKKLTTLILSMKGETKK